MNKEDIGECKNQIQAGILNLQLSLQLVNLQATYIAPQLANRTLLEKLEDIQKLLAAQSVDKRLQECADTYLSRGTTLYEKSVASSIGGFQSQSRPKAIAEWLEQLDALRLDGSASPSLPPDDDLYSSPSQSLDTQETATTFHNDPKPSISQPADPDDEDDDEEEFAMEMVQVALDSGRVSYKDANYQGAEDRLGECLVLIRKLPEHRRRGYDIEEIHLLLALCAFHLHESATAEAALVSALDCNRGMNAQTDLHHSAGAALAIVYIRLKKYEPARFACENVYKGRRRLLGKDNDLCFESLALLALIYELQELPARANTYRSMVPKDKQSALHETFCLLAQPKSTQVLAESKQDAESKQVDVVVDKEWMVWEKLRVHSLAISTTSKMLAYGTGKTGGFEPAIELRRLDDNRAIRTISALKDAGPATTLEFDHQGKRLFSSHGGDWSWGLFRIKGFELSVRIWNVENGQCIHVYSIARPQDRLHITTLRYSRKDERLIFTYDFETLTSSKPKIRAKLKPGFTVLDSASGAVVHQKDCGTCYIRNFSEDFSLVSLEMGKVNTVRTYEIKDYDTAAAEENLNMLNRPGGEIYSLYRSDGSLLILTSTGHIYKIVHDKDPQIWLKVQRLNPESPQIRHAWMGFSSEGRLVVLFTTEHGIIFVAVPEIGLCTPISEGADKYGNLATRLYQNAPLWAVSEDSKYLAYVRYRSGGSRIQVLDVEEQLKKFEAGIQNLSQS